MSDSRSYPDVDPALYGWLKNPSNQWQIAQYSLKDQLFYLENLAAKFGLQDAADWLRNKILEREGFKKDR